MALERRDPIPPGKYWVDALPVGVLWPDRDPPVDPQREFVAWRKRPDVAGKIRLRKTSLRPDGIEFILFDVLAPVPRWAPYSGLGFPTVAMQANGEPVTDVTDTYSAPEPGPGDGQRRIPQARFSRLLPAHGGHGVDVSIAKTKVRPVL